MSHVNYTEFRQHLAAHMDEVCNSRAPLTVTRQAGRSVVVMAEEEYEGLMETLHLLKNPINADRLLRSIAQADGGQTTERALIDPDAP